MAEPSSVYETTTNVDEELGLLADHEEIARLMHAGNFQAAETIYLKGAHSKPVATLRLAEETAQGFPEFSAVQGTTVNGEDVFGKTAMHYSKGVKELRVFYDNPEGSPECRTGGSSKPSLDGCFMEESEIFVNTVKLKYSYDPSIDNGNERSIGGLSLNADRRFRMSQNAPIIHTLKAYVDYFRHSDYADRLVKQALRAIDPANNPTQATQEIVATMVDLITEYYHLGHFMIRDLEMATFQCLERREEKAIEALDRAFTFHAGGGGSKWMSLADKTCSLFKTCTGKHGTAGPSYINERVRESFITMKAAIPKHECASVRHHKDRIVGQLRAAVIQGMLASTYEAELKLKAGSASPRSNAEQRTVDMYSRVLSPWISVCHHQDIQPLHETAGITGKDISMLSLEGAVNVLEHSYHCLNVNCIDVGGLWDAKSKKYITKPCLDDSTAPIEVPPRNYHIGTIFGTLILAGATFLGYRRYKHLQVKKARKERRRAADPNFYDSDSDSSDSSSYDDHQFT